MKNPWEKFFLFAFAIGHIAFTAATTPNLTLHELADIFELYDLPDEKAYLSPGCRPKYFDDAVCPKDNDKLPCSSLEDISDHCISLMGGAESIAVLDEIDVAQDHANHRVGREQISRGLGSSAIRGCIRYVSAHIHEHYHMACCETEYCERMIVEKLAKVAQKVYGDEYGIVTGGSEDEEDDDGVYDDQDDDHNKILEMK